MAEKYVTLYFSDNIATEFSAELFFLICKDKLVSINSREEAVSWEQAGFLQIGPHFFLFDTSCKQWHVPCCEPSGLYKCPAT